jgi:hypothetical protein
MGTVANEVLIFDSLFNTKSFQNIHLSPSYIKWVRPPNLGTFATLNNKIGKYNEKKDIGGDYTYTLNIEFRKKVSPIFFSEQYMRHAELVKSDNKICLLMEPKELHPENYEKIKEIDEQFKYILTYNKELQKKDPSKYLHYVFGGSWINPLYVKIYSKSKNLSACFSKKRSTEGHKLRYSIYDEFNELDICDFYGDICDNRIYDKVDAIKDYRFHFTIENVKCNDFFTEKLIDCFLLGTIPIYWGTSNIGKYFDTRGMILVENLNDIVNIIPELNEDYYMDRCKYIDENFKRAKEYMIPEDWIYKKYPFLFQ